MNEEQLRAIVREAVARRLGERPGVPEVRAVTYLSHSSHARYRLPESDGPCLIEPAVPCTHCGYCQSHGH